ncbi:P-loop containing nucleoside triphosphate hydrolase [Pseudocohnilembus persalinus]|uniref:Katanin p60 ATPase-containing subunit A1 n=1 Tax=Pseudocohnilembus persalinus TaxID=266149 RepID=A0A0V0QFI5_PSEPJ|nr:P-loop containing nucleoside triphosphate hydrolase [Pseudocohnilembus persalinus]|eukprot:KRX00955.1 P-loop containing nucleoside triphosphate hydrolase [Pseudocohnilembus persalinus]
MTQGIKVLEQIRQNIKQGREKAFFGQYQEAINIFQPQLKQIEEQLRIISDADLKNQWQKLQKEINAELLVVESLFSVVNKGQFYQTPQKLVNKDEQQVGSQNKNNDLMNNQYNQQQQNAQMPQQQDYQNDYQQLQQQQQQQQKKPAAQKKYFPFDQVPFAHHHYPFNMMNNPSQHQQQFQQKQKAQSSSPFEDPWNYKNQQNLRNQNYQNNNNNNYERGNKFQPNIFGANQDANINKDSDFENNWLRPNLNKNQEKDPMVWDPPAPMKANRKSNPQPSYGQRNNNNKNYLDKIKGGQGNNKQDAENKRNYKKPWTVNAKTPKQEQKKGNNMNNNSELQERDSYLYSVYPDGRGPDAELIGMLEKEIVDKNPSVKFEDIAELETAKDILQEAVLLPLLMPKFFTGIKRPWKGVLLFGPPGTGKTMLAKAVATTGKTTFFNVSVSSLGSKWRGESEKLVRILFEMARFYAPTTIFFDEVDSIGGQRTEGQNEASRRVMAEMLVQMDGCGGSGEEEQKKTVMVLAATNHPWDIDNALRRRLEKRILIPLPTENGRKELFNIYLKNLKVEENINWDELIKKTEGFSGADIANICREAALIPMRKLLKKQGGFKNIADMEQLQKDAEVPLSFSDFEESLKNCSRSVSSSDLKKYDEWMAEFGSV